MTIQACDYVWYKGEKFVLIDCEKNKDMIDSANFDLKNQFMWTACYRGYTAEYFIEEDVLFGIKSVSRLIRTDSKKNPIRIETEQTLKLKLNYNGSIVIASNNDERLLFLDFLDSYLDCEQAFEMYFIDGCLMEVNDLLKAIKEWKEIEKSMKSENIDFRDIYNAKRVFAEKHLEYEYGCSYKFMQK